jgi:ATP-dependent helicase/DNAse subunit B
MTREDIIAMAKKSRLAVYGLGVDYTKFDDALEHFAKLVAEHEREACAKMFDEAIPLMPFAQNDQGGCLICGFTPKLTSAAIRARSKHDTR